MLKYLISFLLIASVCNAGLPPTTTKGLSGATKSTTFDFQAPYNQYTKTSSTAGLVETGSYNLIANPSFEATTVAAGWQYTLTTPTAVAATGTNIFVSKSVTWDSTAAAQAILSSQETLPVGFYGLNCEASIYTKTPTLTSTHTLVAYGSGSVVLASAPVINSDTVFTKQTVTFPCPTSGTIQLAILAVAANEPIIALDDAYLGLARNVGTIQQATYVGSLKISGCALYTRSNTAFGSMGVSTGCTYSATGDVLAPTTQVFGFRIQNSAAGRYLINSRGSFGKTTATTNSDVSFRFTDGATTFSEQILSYSSASGQADSGGFLQGAISYTTSASTRSFEIEGKTSTTATGTSAFISTDAGTNALGDISGAEFDVYFFPSTSMSVITANQQRTPTVQKFTSGSGTYTTPAGVTYIEVKMVGGGGGGSSSGTAATNNGGTGGNTTFGSSLLTANGGAGGGISSSNATGGTATVSSPAIGSGWDGANGQGAQYNNLADGTHGGMGGSSIFAGAGSGGGYSTAGSAAKTNTGSGGGGGGGNAAVAGVYAGGGGASGAGIIAKIVAPSSSYAYAIGSGGTGGGAGTSGFAGGNGAAGYIEVTEFYGYTTALLANSVSTGNISGDVSHRLKFNCTGSSSIVSQDGSWVSSVGNLSSGTCTVAWPSTTFSAAPTCTNTITSCSASTGTSCFGNFVPASPSTTGATAACYSDTGAACTAASFDIHCIGPR